MSGTDLGAWGEENLELTARGYLGTGSDAGLHPRIRFQRAVVTLLRKRLALVKKTNTTEIPGFGVFVLNAGAMEAPQNSTPVAMLDNGLHSLTESVWVVNEAVNWGHKIDIASFAEYDVFLHVRALGLGNSFAAIFENRTPSPELRFYPHGLQDLSAVFVVQIERDDIDEATVYKAIDRVYENGLVTPEACGGDGRVWQSSDNCWPRSSAETEIQWLLKTSLSVAFPGCVIRDEQSTIAGRIDIEIEEPDALDKFVVTRHALLELKVLRSYTMSGNAVPDGRNLTAVEDGVQQAGAYKKKKQHKFAALCCFDMTETDKGNSWFEHVVDLAKQLSVSLKRWYLYASSKAYREATS